MLNTEDRDHTTPAGQAAAFEYQAADSLPEWFKKIPVFDDDPELRPSIFTKTKEEGNIVIDLGCWIVREADGRVYRAVRYTHQSYEDGFPFWLWGIYNGGWDVYTEDSLQIITTTGPKLVNMGDWIIGDTGRHLKSYTDAEFREKYGLAAA